MTWRVKIYCLGHVRIVYLFGSSSISQLGCDACLYCTLCTSTALWAEPSATRPQTLIREREARKAENRKGLDALVAAKNELLPKRATSRRHPCIPHNKFSPDPAAAMRTQLFCCCNSTSRIDKAHVCRLGSH